MRLVTDANIWIDLDHGGLLGRVFSMGDTLLIPDIILAEELLSVDVELLRELGIREVGLSGKQAAEVQGSLAQLYPRASPKDLTALIYARDRKHHVLLTGDEALRRAAEKEQVEVHGVLWVLDRLVELRVLQPVEAARSLRLILHEGGRLPAQEVAQRLRSWDGG